VSGEVGPAEVAESGSAGATVRYRVRW